MQEKHLKDMVTVYIYLIVIKSNKENWVLISGGM